MLREGDEGGGRAEYFFFLYAYVPGINLFLSVFVLFVAVFYVFVLFCFHSGVPGLIPSGF